MKSLLRLLIPVLLATLLCGCYGFEKSSTYYGVRTAGQNVVFVIDTSGSMEGKDEGSIGDQVTHTVVERSADAVEHAIGGFLGRMAGKQVSSEATKLGSAKRALIPALRGLEASSRYAIVQFGGHADAWHEHMVAATSTQKNADIARVEQLSADGSTPMLAALERSFRYQGATTIFLLTDGRPDGGSTGQILDRVRALNADRHIVVHTIGFGEDKDAGFLQTLARENGGRYVDQSHAGQLLPF